MGGFSSAFSGLQNFLEAGGPVLVVIMVTAFILWSFIIERLVYWFGGGHAAVVSRVKAVWAGRSEHKSWRAHAVRDKLLSEARQGAEQNVELVKTVVAIAPLLGLMGTVTGMIDVFDVMATTGSSSARGMASGVTKATVPTMAGMVVALSGFYFTYWLDQQARRKTTELAEDLEIK